MLRTLTLDGIAAKKWFETWDEELDEPHLTNSRRLISTLIHDLKSAPKLTKVAVRRLLRSTVKAFNRLDAASHFIETTHREDIYEALELIICAARQPDLVDEVDQWRDW